MSIIARLQPASVFTERLADNSIIISDVIPPDWNVWSSDGRIYPTPGIYRIEAWGEAARLRQTDGVFQNIQVPLALRIETGEAVLPPSSGTAGGIAIQRID